MPDYSTQPRAAKRTPRSRSRPRKFLRFLVFLGALAASLLIAFHTRIPDRLGLGLLVDNAAPWFGLLIPVLLLAALVSRSKTSLVVLLVPILTWVAAFGPSIIPLSWTAPEAAAQTLVLASQNIKAGTGAAAQSALELAADGSDVIALQELDADSANKVTDSLGAAYPHHFVVGTVGVWSKYPLEGSRSLDLGLGWKRALRTQVVTRNGEVQLYVIHAASARPNDHIDRDVMLDELASTVETDPQKHVIALGDFNATSTDRSFARISSVLKEPNQDDGLFGFTWPRDPFGMMRLDHVLVRGLEVTSNTTVPAGISDHLAVRATVNLPEP